MIRNKHTRLLFPVIGTTIGVDGVSNVSSTKKHEYGVSHQRSLGSNDVPCFDGFQRNTLIKWTKSVKCHPADKGKNTSMPTSTWWKNAQYENNVNRTVFMTTAEVTDLQYQAQDESNYCQVYPVDGFPLVMLNLKQTLCLFLLQLDQSKVLHTMCLGHQIRTQHCWWLI